MTEKLYYSDPFLKEFTATVLACEEAKGGFKVVLDRTAFYPEGGGQAADKGTLGGIEVLHVHEDGERVLHRMAQPLTVGETVTGIIDYDHRFDLMQQHTGEHIVSGVEHKMFGCENVGFHLSTDIVTLDFDKELTAEQIMSLPCFETPE